MLSYEEMLNGPGFLIRRCHQISVAIFTEETGELEFSPSQFAALLFIHRHPGTDQRTLGEQTALDRSSVTKCVDRLERCKLISRDINPADKRARLLYTTPDGCRLLENLSQASRRARQRIEECLGTERFHEMLNLLKAMADGLNDVSRAPVSFTPRGTNKMGDNKR